MANKVVNRRIPGPVVPMPRGSQPRTQVVTKRITMQPKAKPKRQGGGMRAV